MIMADKQIEQEIAALISGQLKIHGQVHIDGLGTFLVRHKKQEQQQEKNGRIVMKPPADIIEFTPED